ncbi:helix-turn-helix domain-containing protein [Slackia exigua]|uniref:helix-turn-helix domain-containing protein n=1 Tax=Slackia exigua TaxID=84109 RepID=UPI0020054A37|nr:helix-turn-helix transcriptional regulator [Slackia exigua]MCK6139961.1 helix-turn-helix transcriptional regulator [Slackia exigua]
MNNTAATVFPVRLFGFALFWSWLFLMAVSPSPLFGLLVGIGGTPFEVSEVGFRILFLVGAVFFCRSLATVTGRRVLLVVCLISGPLAAAALQLAHAPSTVTLASVLVAATDVSMFLMWMCFFGYSKLGETALLIVASYAIGALLCLIVIALGRPAMMLFAAGLPVASGAAFVLSVRYATAQQGEALFEQAEQSEADRKYPAPIIRMTIALTLYAFVFALYSSRTASSEFFPSSGPVLQAVCCPVLAIVVGLALHVTNNGRGLYVVYRSVPIVFAVGFALFALASAHLALASGLCIMLAYLMFEALSLNDYCNAAKTNDASLVHSMTFVRLAMSVGMLVGWVLGFMLGKLLPEGASPTLVGVVCLVVVLVAATVVFTDKAASELGAIADDRALQETAESKPDRMALVPAFAAEHGLSNRETEVLDLLLAGRTSQYIAEKLLIAESTARTHVHKIYHKTETHDRMNLIDQFERFCETQTDKE